MAQARVIRKLCELGPQQIADFFALLHERTHAKTREGKPYFACKFRDAKRTATCMVWGDSDLFAECERDWLPGAFYKLRATYDEHRQYGPTLFVHKLRPVVEQDRAEGFVEADLLDRSRFDSEVMFAELVKLATDEIADEPLRQLVTTLLEVHAERLKLLPGSPKHYYAFPGGWLEHVLSVTRTCLLLVDRYREIHKELSPPLNRDLVIAGSILHEIGRVAELQPTTQMGETPEKTVPGQLFGHIVLGRDMIREVARGIEKLDAQLLMLLEHIVQTYLALPEWGSPRLPAIPEVLILHHADDLDAKLEMYARCLRRDMGAGPFTDRDPVLGRQLLRDRKA